MTGPRPPRTHAPRQAAVVGMGYVGAVSAAALAQRDWAVVGVEVNPTMSALLQAGASPISEPGLNEAIAAATEAGRFQATDDLAAAVRDAEVVMVAVGTPTGDDGQADLEAIDRVTEQLAEALRTHPGPCVVMIRSTVPPGTTQQRIAPLIRRANPRIAVCHHPEFLREGSAMADWAQPPMIVWGADAADAAPAAVAIAEIYHGLEAPRLALGTAESELMKYACNVFHALKIDFANEIGAVASACGADADAVMAALCQDRKLNIAPAYLRPGFAFGGSCLPKDTRALGAQARQQGLELPLIEAVLHSNREHLSRQVDRILAQGRQPALLLGLSFKPHTDDLRESPMVELAERLLGKGVPLTIHDPDVSDSSGRLLGANARYVHEHLPHLNLLLRPDLVEAVRQARTVIIAKPIGELSDVMLAGKTVIDLTVAPPAAARATPAHRRAA